MTDMETDVAVQLPATPAAEALTPVRKRPVAQEVLDRAVGDCEAFARLSDRLERIRIAFEGRGAEPRPGAKLGPKPTSHLEGLNFVHACNVEVRGRMEAAIARFEDLLGCDPVEDAPSS